MQRKGKMKLSLRLISGMVFFAVLGLVAAFFIITSLVQDVRISMHIMFASVVIVGLVVACTYFFIIRNVMGEINATHKRVQAMLDASPLIVEYWNAGMKMIDCNLTTPDAYGYTSKDEYLQKFDAHRGRYGESVNTFCDGLKKAFETGSCHFEFEDTYADGTRMLLEVDGVRTIIENEPVVVTYSRDVTQMKNAAAELKRLEVAEESNRTKSDFLARMSHEIRTPITVVLGISEIELRKHGLPMHTKESFGKIHSSANMLLDIVNDILDLSKIEAGRMTLFQKEYSSASMINDITHLNLDYLDTKNLEFRLCVDENLPEYLFGDVLRIEQILNNLLSNSFKYTEGGSVELAWTSRPHESKDDHVILEISVTDTGFGMTKSQLFILQNSEYTRFHEHENRNIDGTGLGLPIVYNLLKLMDGHIKIESEVGAGTKVTVHIPQKLSKNPGTLGKETADALEKFERIALFTGEKFTFTPEPMPYGSVLIVDDVDANIYVAKGLLAFYDLKIETCNSGYEAIDRVKRGEIYDIIFMDYMMPGLNGTETMQILRDKGYVAPIVALTANAIIGQAEELIKSGFDDFISKPIQTKHLNATLNKFIRDKQPPEVIMAAVKSRPKKRASDMQDFQQGVDLTEKLRQGFARNHADAYDNIMEAVESGDTEAAILAAHTLKSVAGLIREHALVKISARMEQILTKGEIPSKKFLDTAERELKRVLAEISAPDVPDLSGDTFSESAALVLLSQIEPLLETQDTECITYTTELQKIPNSAELREKIENFDFIDALETLRRLKSEIEGGQL